MTRIISTNPSLDYAVLGSVASTTESEIIGVVERAKKAQGSWLKTPLVQRVSLMRDLYVMFVQKKEIIARSVSEEMGMPIRLARDEVEYGLNYFLWYLGHAEKYLSPEVVLDNETETHIVHYEPKGVVAAITPWNYPFMLCIWVCVQPILAGNTVVWKISKEVILTGKIIGDIIQSSPLPTGVWTEIYGDGNTGDILTNQDIDGITFTGSTPVGDILSRKALQKHITAVMELGGSAPGIICADADIDAVLETLYFMRFSNSGQMCDGLKRLMVHRSRYDELVSKLSERLRSKKIGNPLLEETDIGPLVSAAQKITVEKQLQDALEKGAVIACELPVPEGLSGAYISPKILTNITFDMQIWKEEVFGPILPVIPFDTVDEAVGLANDTTYGLGAYVFTESQELFDDIAARIDSGMVQLNNVNYCVPTDPFGGYKSSGIGREHGKWGFHELCNIKVTSTPKNKKL